MKQKFNFIIALSLFVMLCCAMEAEAQNVNIPDVNFKNWLINNASINVNLDDEIQLSEAVSYTGAINLNTLSIYDLTGIEAFLNLSSLTCYGNFVTDVDLSANTSLTYLVLTSNQITSLDVSNNLLLTHIDCSSNQLSVLDLSSNSLLTNIYCSFNQLVSLNVQNGNNNNIMSFFAASNPDLVCIQVDNATISTTNWANIDPTASFSEDCSSVWCTVDIPDENFNNYLINNSMINTNGDSFIQCDEALAFTGTIDVYNLNIAEMSGLEAFENLYGLNCSNNQIVELDLSANTLLTYLHCSSNLLTELDITSNVNLSYVYCSYNFLTAIDLSSNLQLLELSCDGNNLDELDLTSNQSLEFLEFGNSTISSINLSENINLKYLDFADALIENISLNNNVLLEYFNCSANQISSIDLSDNPALITVYCSSNQLVSLNVKNGNNLLIENFYASDNPELTCIMVDDPAWATSNWAAHVPEGVVFSEDCYFCSIDVSVSQEQNVLTAIASGYTYQWVDCDNEYLPISGEINQSYAATTDGNYAVIITESFECSDTSDCYSVVGTGRIKELAESLITVYPNPCDGLFRIELKGENAARVVVTDVLGETSFISDLHDGINIIDMQFAKGGIYLYIIYGSEGNVRVGKIIIE